MKETSKFLQSILHIDIADQAEEAILLHKEFVKHPPESSSSNKFLDKKFLLMREIDCLKEQFWSMDSNFFSKKEQMLHCHLTKYPDLAEILKRLSQANSLRVPFANLAKDQNISVALYELLKECSIASKQESLTLRYDFMAKYSETKFSKHKKQVLRIYRNYRKIFLLEEKWLGETFQISEWKGHKTSIIANLIHVLIMIIIAVVGLFSLVLLVAGLEDLFG